MSKAFAKLGFIHRRLWQRDGLYRLALLFGPAPLLGCLAAFAIWYAVVPIIRAPQPAPAVPWAKVERPPTWSAGGDQPHVVEPSRPLPPSSANGGLVGYVPGWEAAIAPMTVNPTDVNVKPQRLRHFLIESPAIDMARIMQSGAGDDLYAGAGVGFLAVRTAGVYGLSARLERRAAPTANCLVRIGFGQHRITSNIVVGIHDDISRTFEAARFDLQPGLYWIGWVFGCWRGHEVTGPGRMTLLVGRPGETGLSPARAGDIVRPDPDGQ